MTARQPPFNRRQMQEPISVGSVNAIDQMPTPQPQLPRTGFTPVQRVTQPPLAQSQPGLFSYMNRPIMPTTPKPSAAFVQGNGIEEEAASTAKPEGSSVYKAQGNYGYWDLQKPTQDTCKGIRGMAERFNVPNVQSWIRHNCMLIQTMMIRAPCDIIFNFVDQCYKRKLL
ncbi:hypothetical protein L596_006358 [Steinernema carpocapsae]|uniref:aECM cysteine-cradle domain-containing protein n=1 Tax=Steinernema carpocapsae TaxID=34508 RepID=A0A4U8V228_STECR|nr:hypothetical protein L596_006358 [Steinernema carpocapsae]